MAKGFVTRAFEGKVLAKGTFLGKATNSAAASDLSQTVKREKVSKALSIGSEKAGMFENKNARKRA